MAFSLPNIVTKPDLLTLFHGDRPPVYSLALRLRNTKVPVWTHESIGYPKMDISHWDAAIHYGVQLAQYCDQTLSCYAISRRLPPLCSLALRLRNTKVPVWTHESIGYPKMDISHWDAALHYGVQLAQYCDQTLSCYAISRRLSPLCSLALRLRNTKVPVWTHESIGYPKMDISHWDAAIHYGVQLAQYCDQTLSCYAISRRLSPLCSLALRLRNTKVPVWTHESIGYPKMDISHWDAAIHYGIQLAQYCDQTRSFNTISRRSPPVYSLALRLRNTKVPVWTHESIGYPKMDISHWDAAIHYGVQLAQYCDQTLSCYAISRRLPPLCSLALRLRNTKVPVWTHESIGYPKMDISYWDAALHYGVQLAQYCDQTLSCYAISRRLSPLCSLALRLRNTKVPVWTHESIGYPKMDISHWDAAIHYGVQLAQYCDQTLSCYAISRRLPPLCSLALRLRNTKVPVWTHESIGYPKMDISHWDAAIHYGVQLAQYCDQTLSCYAISRRLPPLCSLALRLRNTKVPVWTHESIGYPKMDISHWDAAIHYGIQLAQYCDQTLSCYAISRRLSPLCSLALRLRNTKVPVWTHESIGYPKMDISHWDAAIHYGVQLAQYCDQTLSCYAISRRLPPLCSLALRLRNTKVPVWTHESIGYPKMDISHWDAAIHYGVQLAQYCDQTLSCYAISRRLSPLCSLALRLRNTKVPVWTHESIGYPKMDISHWDAAIHYGIQLAQYCDQTRSFNAISRRSPPCVLPCPKTQEHQSTCVDSWVHRVPENGHQPLGRGNSLWRSACPILWSNPIVLRYFTKIAPSVLPCPKTQEHQSTCVDSWVHRVPENGHQPLGRGTSLWRSACPILWSNPFLLRYFSEIVPSVLPCPKTQEHQSTCVDSWVHRVPENGHQPLGRGNSLWRSACPILWSNPFLLRYFSEIVPSVLPCPKTQEHQSTCVDSWVHRVPENGHQPLGRGNSLWHSACPILWPNPIF